MTMKLAYQYTGRDGYEAVVREPGNMRHIREFGVLKLGAVQRHAGDTGDCEALLHIYSGTVTVRAGGAVFQDIGGRAHVFAGLPTAVYLPPRTAYTITGERAEVAILQAAASGGGEPRLIRPEDVKIVKAGKDNWSREVRLIAPSGNGFTRKMVLGETINPPGNWSGIPPHKHDRPDPPRESLHDELYLFRFDKPQGWGLERQYDHEGLDTCQVLKENVVTLMPKGFHPVVAAPGYTMYYMFWLVGADNALIQKEDEAHSWIKG